MIKPNAGGDRQIPVSPKILNKSALFAICALLPEVRISAAHRRSKIRTLPGFKRYAVMRCAKLSCIDPKIPSTPAFSSCEPYVAETLPLVYVSRNPRSWNGAIGVESELDHNEASYRAT